MGIIARRANVLLAIAAFCFGVTSLGCGNASSPPAARMTPTEPFTDPNLSERAALGEAVQLATVEPAPDPAGLLAAACDPGLSPERRRRAALLFWRRHAPVGAPLASVAAKMPPGARWPSREHIALTAGLAG